MASRCLLEALTARLPEWFAQPDSNRHYAEQAEFLESWTARIEGSARGLLLLKKHSAVGAEIYWLAVHPAHHRQGIGRALIEAVYAAADAAGVPAVYWLTAEDNYAGRMLYDKVAQRSPFIRYQRRLG